MLCIVFVVEVVESGVDFPERLVLTVRVIVWRGRITLIGERGGETKRGTVLLMIRLRVVLVR
jgi:hypothetical protein